MAQQPANARDLIEAKTRCIEEAIQQLDLTLAGCRKSAARLRELKRR